MKYLYTIIFFLVISVVLNAQDNNTDLLPAVRYKCRISEGIIGKKRMLRHLDTIIPVVFPELKNSRTCGGDKCNEDFYVELVYSLHVKDRNFYAKSAGKNNRSTEYEHNTSYKIKAYILLKNKEDQTVSYWNLFDDSSLHEYKTKHTLRNPSGEVEKKIITTVDPNTNRYDYQVVLAPVDKPTDNTNFIDPVSYFKNYGITDPQALEIEKKITERLYEFKIFKVKKDDGI